MILESLPTDWTDVQLLEHIKAHLIEQGERSIDDDGLCRYRQRANGKVLACAVGCVIPDEYYSEDIEGYDVDGAAAETPHDELDGFLMSRVDVLGTVQKIHDDYPAWEERTFPEYASQEIDRMIAGLM